MTNRELPLLAAGLQKTSRIPVVPKGAPEDAARLAENCMKAAGEEGGMY